MKLSFMTLSSAHPFFLFLALTGVMNSAHADHESKDRKAYLGISIGSGDYDDGGLYDDMKTNDSNSAIKIYGGYRLSPYFSIEGSLTSFGEVEAYNTQADIDGNFSALMVSFVGQIPTESGFAFYGQAGVGFVSIYQEIHYIAPGTILVEDDESDTDIALMAGAGITYTAPSLKELSFKLGFERYYYSTDMIVMQSGLPRTNDEDQELDSIYLGLAFNF